MHVLFLISTVLYGLLSFMTQGHIGFLAIALGSVLTWHYTKTHKSEDSDGQVEFRDDRVYLSGRRLSRFPWLWPAQVRNLVYQKAFELSPIQKLASLSDEGSGISITGAELTMPLGEKCAHGILVGPTGSGKTELVKRLVARFSGEVWVVEAGSGSGSTNQLKASKKINLNDPDSHLVLLDELARREVGAYYSPALLVVDRARDLVG
ncbi:MAG: hypothetical protein RL418_508, partial [Actinomycetota bacterium]